MLCISSCSSQTTPLAFPLRRSSNPTALGRLLVQTSKGAIPVSLYLYLEYAHPLPSHCSSQPELRSSLLSSTQLPLISPALNSYRTYKLVSHNWVHNCITYSPTVFFFPPTVNHCFTCVILVSPIVLG